MKTILISLFFIVSSSALAETYLFGKQMVAFEKVDSLTVNKSCRDKKCIAYKMGQEFRNAPLSPADKLGGKNPMAVRCKKLMKGSLVIGNDPAGHEQSFCTFSDDSFLKH